MNTQTELRNFRRILWLIAVLTLLVFGGSTVLGTLISNKDGGSLASYNLGGISTMIPAILPSILVGIVALFVAMYSIGKLLGENWRDNLRAMLDNYTNDSVFVLSEKIAIATTFAALSVPLVSNPFIWLMMLLSKLIALLALSIVISTILSAFLIWGSQTEDFEWWQVDAWWIAMMNQDGNDMAARITGLAFQIVGVAMLGALLVANI